MRTIFATLFLIGTAFFLLSGGAIAAPVMEPLEELKSCARTKDETQRIACYEELGRRILEEESVTAAEAAGVERNVVEAEAVATGVVESEAVKSQVTAPVVVEAAATEATTATTATEATVVETTIVETASPPAETPRLPDDLGIKKKQEQKSAEKESFRGHVRACDQTWDKKWYFVFHSGQIWKQSSKGKHRFKDCDFNVTITKDLFGYKMEIDGGKKLRVRRER